MIYCYVVGVVNIILGLLFTSGIWRNLLPIQLSNSLENITTFLHVKFGFYFFYLGHFLSISTLVVLAYLIISNQYKVHNVLVPFLINGIWLFGAFLLSRA